MEKECQVFIDYVIEHIPSTKTNLDHIKDMQSRDRTMKQLKVYMDKGWPVHRKALPENLLQFWSFRADMHVADGILLKGG